MSHVNARIHTTAGIATLVAVLAGDPAPVQAQQPAVLEEVIVSARKREENLQEVPLSISVINEVELRRSNAVTLDTVANLTPGLAFNDVNGAYQSPVIRGLTQTDQTALEGNVGVFIDGLYLDNRSALEFGLIELDRIEVMKGPQSALYGRNTFAGAINYVTKAPVLGEWGGLVEGTVGDQKRWGARGSLNVPIGSRVALRIFGGDSAFGGTIDNDRDGAQLGGYPKRASYGGQLLIEPSDAFRIKLFGARNDRDDEQPAFRVYYPGQINNCGALFNTAPLGQPVVRTYSLYCGDAPDTDSVDLDPRGDGVKTRADVYYASLGYDFSSFSLSALIGRTETSASTFIDQAGDRTAFQRRLTGNFSLQFFTNAASDKGESTSYEVRAQSRGESALRWLVGASYFDTSAGSILASTATPVGATSPLSPISQVIRTLATTEKAVFGSLGGSITDRLRVNAEVRYAEIDQQFSGFTALLFLPIPPIVVPANSQKLTSTTPRLTVDYDVAPGVMLFGSAARGWKAGGFNTAVAPYATYAPETNWSFEFGAKSTLLEGRLTLNGALFYIDWKGLQIPAPIDVVGNTAVVNLGGAKSQGIEIESAFAITPQFNVRVGANFMDPKFNSGVTDGSLFTICGRRPDSGIIGPPCSIDVGGKQIPKVPKTQIFASTSYTWPDAIFGFDSYARADFSHQSKKYVNSLNTSNAGDIDLLNIRLGLTRDNTEIALWMDNVTDQNWVRSLQSVLDPGINTPCLTRGQNCSAQLLRVYPGDRRTIGITATQRF